MAIGRLSGPIGAGSLGTALYASAQAGTNGGWTGHDQGGQRFSPLAQITSDIAATRKASGARA
jgi:hypothetical protein